MLVTVRSATPTDPPTVQCDSGVGPIIGLWRGDAAPVVGASFDVELDADGGLSWGTGAAIVSADGANRDGEVLRGHVEDIEGEFVAVRVGNALLALTVEGEPPLDVIGEVAVSPVTFSFWPTGV